MTPTWNNDDYYSSLKKDTSSSWADEKKVVVTKLKVKAKKIVKVEPKPAPQEDKAETVVKPEVTPPEKEKVVFTAKKISSAQPGEESTPVLERKKPTNSAPWFRRERPAKQKWGALSEETSGKKYKSAKKSKLKFKGMFDGEDDSGAFKRATTLAAKKKEEKDVGSIKQTLVDRSGQEVEIPDFLTVKEFSDKIGVPLAMIIGELLKNGVMVNINSQIDFDTAYLIGETYNITMKRQASSDAALSDVMDGNIANILATDEASEKVERPPIVSVMGHVDHGKTSILDYIRKSNVASGEAGGITQSIGAYQVSHNDKKIAFLDTPGHEAFALMRARGARVTDIIILVVAADEWLKPQTIESIDLAKEAKVPVIVAINKMDKEWANPELVKGGLNEHGLQPEDWWGDTICVPCSAKTGDGIDKLLDMVLLVADVQEYKAHPSRPGVGTVVESHLDPGQGVLATVLVNAGVFKKGDDIYCGVSSGKVRTMRDYKGKNIAEAGPSTPIQITGLSDIVEGGDVVQVVKDSDTARARAQEFKLASASKSVKQFEGASLSSLMNKLKSGSLKDLKIVLKADTNGSLEALKAALLKVEADEVQVKIIHSWVGAINESDVLMAGTSSALLVGFNVSKIAAAQDTLNKSQIEVISDKVIYRIIERVEEIATGMVDIKHVEQFLGVAVVKEIFFSTAKMQIIGLGVVEGKIENKAKIRIIREERTAGTGVVDNLKKWIEDVHEVEAPEECGISFVGTTKPVKGDRLEFFKVVERK